LIATLIVTAALSQSYARSRAVEGDPTTQCLWWKEKTNIVFRQNQDGSPETPGNSFAAVTQSFATWQQHLSTCASLSLTEGPRTSQRRAEFIEDGNNENIVVFRQRDCRSVAPTQDPCVSDGSCGNKYDCWQFAAGAIAITTTNFSARTAQVLDSDIELNTPSYLFTTVDAPMCTRGSESFACVATDIQNTMTHEIGHLLGLAHINDPASTMNPRAVTGELAKRTLDVGSKRFACEVYAKSQPSRTCFIQRLGIEESPAPIFGCALSPGALAAGATLVLLGLRRRRGV
jgi:hypothetical protein